MTPVYTDASSAILLHRAGLFERAARVFSHMVAGEVYRELNRDHYPGAGVFRSMAESGAIRVLGTEPDLVACSRLDGFSAMDRGEQETLALYMGAQKDTRAFVLIDDGQGARFCHRHHIPFINALLVPKIFWYSGLMDETTARKNMETLMTIGRYSSRIISKANDLSKEDLAFFIPGMDDA